MITTQTSLFESTTKKPLPPLLKWLGGKRDLAPRLAAMYEPYRSTHTWVDSFCGGLGAALGVMPERAILSDVNSDLINFYQQIKLGLQNTVAPSEVLGSVDYWQNSKERYYQIREDFNNAQAGDWWKAKAFYYLNRTGFRGLCRYSEKSGFNVPWGAYKNPVLDHDFSLYQKAFENWHFLNIGYAEVLNNLSFFDAKDYFIYADPPYDDGFVNYSGTFTWEDQVNLATQLSELDFPVVASNKATERIINLYKELGFDVEIISMARRISCDGNRDRVDEILASKNIK